MGSVANTAVVFPSFKLASYSGSFFSCVSVPVNTVSIFFCGISLKNWCKTEQHKEVFQRGNFSLILPHSSGELLHTAEGSGWLDTHGCASLKHLMQTASLTYTQKGNTSSNMGHKSLISQAAAPVTKSKGPDRREGFRTRQTTLVSHVCVA